MIFKIDKQDYELNFGIGMLEELDKINPLSSDNGISMGMGFSKTYGGIEGGDITSYIKAIYAATFACSPRPSMQAVGDAFIKMTPKELKTMKKELSENLKALWTVSEALQK